MTRSLRALPAQLGLALALAAIPLLMLTSEHWQSIYAGTVAASTVLAGLSQPRRIRLVEGMQVTLMLALLIVPILASILANSPEETHLGNLSLLVCYAALGLWLFPVPRDHSLDRFHLIALVSIAAMLPQALGQVLIDQNMLSFAFEQGTSRNAFRFGETLNSEDIHPNFFGQYCMVFVFAAQSLRHRIFRIASAILALAVCVILSSRGGMLGVVMAFGSAEIFLRYSAPRQRKSPSLTLLALTFSAAVSLVAFVTIDKDKITDFFAERIILINDDDRGIESGASGRVDLWNDAIELWIENPIFGIGFKQSSTRLSVDLGVHNIFIAILADTGTFGFVCFLIHSGFTIFNARRLWRAGERKVATYIFTALIMFYVYGVFEGNNLGVANPISIIFFIVTFSSCAREHACAKKSMGHAYGQFHSEQVMQPTKQSQP